MQQTATILSAELSGLQAVSESLSPEGITSFIGEIHTHVETTTRMHHGSLNRFTGDTFLLVFHHNKTGKQAAIHALDVAFEINEQLLPLIKDKKLTETFSLKIGLASGNILSTEIGSKGNVQQTIMGEAVKHATRICQFAGEGQTIVDGPSHELVKDHGVFQSLEPIPLKGGTETLAIYELIEKKRRKLDLSTIERKIASEMVGRGREAEQLESLIKKLVAGKGSVVNIVGKAGIGKSRLVAEMKVQPIMENVLLLEGRAMSTGQNLSFHPISNLIKSWAGITEDDVPSVSSEKLLQGIKQNTPEQADEIYAFIATMMGLPLEGKYKERIEGIEGEALEKLILKNLRDLIISAAKDKPRIYLIEDMHWADSSSLTMFESLYKLSQNHPVMFINVMRPGYKETGDYILKWLVDNLPGDNITINVSPLADVESGELISNLLKKVALPEKVASTIIRKSEGNPFFIEEIIRSFLDDGIIEIHEKHFRVTEKIKNINIPETINEVILSRVDKLDEKTKELLKTASVIGRNFYFKVLEEAADTIGELDSRLEYLKDVQLIGESKKKDEIEYLFKHALAQQATYDSIILESKKELHLKIARSIEKVFAENINEFYSTLAYHFEQANNLEKAEEYLIKAGDEALKSGASHEAKQNLEKGFDIYQKLNKGRLSQEILASYYYKLSLACHSRGLNLEAIDYIEKYQGIYLSPPSTNKIRLMLGIIRRVGNLILALNFSRYYFKKDPTIIDDSLIKLAISKGEATLTVNPKKFFIDLIYFTNLVIKWNLLKTQYGVEFIIASSSNFIWTGISHSLGKKIISFTEKYITEENKSAWMKLRYSILMYRLFVGDLTTDPDEDKVYEVGLNSGFFFDTTVYLMFSGYLHIEQGNKPRTNQILNRFIETSETLENIHARVQYYRMASIASWKFRKINELFELASSGLEMIEKTGHLAILMLVQCAKANAHSVCGEIEEAKELLLKVEKIAIGKKRGVIFYSTYLLAKCHLEKAQIEQEKRTKKLQGKDCKSFRKTSSEAVKYSKMCEGNLIEAYRLRAIAFYFSGKHKKAFKYLRKSIAFGESSGGKLELSRAYFETGKFLSNPKVKYNELDGKPASHYLDKAKAMFEEMDLQWGLGELKKFNAAKTSL